jgi:hypothetical protein
MVSHSASGQVDFIQLGDTHVRATSWSGPTDDGLYRLVTITRGSRDAEQFQELLAGQPISLTIPGEDPISVAVESVDRRDAGSGQSAIGRFEVTFRTVVDGVPAPPPASTAGEPGLEQRVAALEQELELLKSALRSFLDRP